jgi:hypothetical protein
VKGAMDKLVEPNIQTATDASVDGEDSGCGVCQQNNEDIHFVLRQAGSQQAINKIASVDNEVADFCLNAAAFKPGSATVEVDYAQQHFVVNGQIQSKTANKLTFNCDDIACMKVRMFLQLLNIQVYKHCQSKDCDTLESAAKLWIDKKAESFAETIDSIKAN